MPTCAPARQCAGRSEGCTWRCCRSRLSRWPERLSGGRRTAPWAPWCGAAASSATWYQPTSCSAAWRYSRAGCSSWWWWRRQSGTLAVAPPPQCWRPQPAWPRCGCGNAGNRRGATPGASSCSDGIPAHCRGCAEGSASSPSGWTICWLRRGRLCRTSPLPVVPASNILHDQATRRRSEAMTAAQQIIAADPAALRIARLRALRGPNVWCLAPVIACDVVAGPLDAVTSADISGFTERITAALPTLAEHPCSRGAPGGFVERLREGTGWPHVLEHVAIELQNLAGSDVSFGRVVESGDAGVWR